MEPLVYPPRWSTRPRRTRRRKRLLRWLRRLRSSVASTRPTCAMKAAASSKPSTKRFASAARHIFLSRSGISRSRVRRTGDTCPSRLRGSIGRALKASMSRPIPMLIPRGSTACRLLFRHGRTTAAMPNSLSGSKTPPLAPAFAKTWRRLPKTGITSGKKSAAHRT